MEWKFSKNEKVNKVILVALCGVMILIILMPMKNTEHDLAASPQGSYVTETVSPSVLGEEERLTAMLEKAYGKGRVSVMIYREESTASTYYGTSQTTGITGVLIVIAREAVGQTTISDITLAVCALFNLPAHKVAVLVR